MTLLRVASSFVISLILGLSLGCIIGKSLSVYSISKPYITVALSIPSICWVAISIMLFGINNVSAIFSVVAIITPVITVNVIAGMKSLNNELMDMAKVFKLERGTVIKHLVIPQLFPFLISATRFGISLSWKVMIIAEMFGTTNGVGYQINYAFGTFSFEDVLAWTILFTSLMIAIEYGVLKPIEAKYSLWKTG
jgi:NitT/TauT family transport system permease protein